MKIFKPKSKKEQVEDFDESYNSHLAAPGEIIRETSARDTVASAALTLGGGIKFIIGIILFAVLVLISIYTAMAGTLMFLAPTSSDSAMERTWVARGTFQGGQIGNNVTVYGSANSDAPKDFFGKAKEGFTGASNHFVVRTIAGPVAEIDSKDGFIYIDDKKTEYKSDVKYTKLVNQYLAQCIEGSCTPGDYVVVNYASISGEVRGTVSKDGVSR